MMSLFTTNRIKRYILFILASSFIISGNLPAQEPDFDNMPVINYSSPRDYGIADITISGVEFLQPMVLISLSGLRIGDIITVPGDDNTDILNNAVRIIKDHFIEKGFYNTEVEIIQKKDTTAGNGAYVQFNISKNNRVKIEEIEFVGNKVYPVHRLKRVFKKTKAININFFKPSKLIQKEYKADKQKLIDFYNEKG